MKKKILLISFPIYALLNFYEKYFRKYHEEYDFFVITNRINDLYFEKINKLKSEKKINDFFFLSPRNTNSFNISVAKNSFSESKKISSALKDFEFEKIICSDFSSPEIKYIINNLSITQKTIIYSFNCHNYKFDNQLYENKIINYLFKPRTLKNAIFRMFKKIMRYKLFPLLYYKYSFAEDSIHEEYPLYSEKLNFLLTDKPYEFFRYKKNFNNIDIDMLLNKNNFDLLENKLFVLTEYLKTDNFYQFALVEYANFINLLNKKFQFKEIYIKPHPRDESNFSEDLKIKLNLTNTRIKKKTSNVSDYLGDFSCILGGSSAAMIEAINLNNSNLVFGMLNLSNRIVKNPGAKELMGDILNFKSGVFWIEDFLNFKKMSKDEVFEISKKLKKERFQGFSNTKNLDQVLFSKEV